MISAAREFFQPGALTTLVLSVASYWTAWQLLDRLNAVLGDWASARRAPAGELPVSDLPHQRRH